MDILIQSLLSKAHDFGTSLRIRYSARSPFSVDQNRPTPNLPTAKGGGMASYVIIQREYSYLEPLVRSIFEEAEDVTILIDRRSAKSQNSSDLPAESERSAIIERRTSAPMLDVLISVPSQTVPQDA